jgi:hypothetical protein
MHLIPNAATIYQLAALDSRALGQPTRRLYLDTQWTKEFGLLSTKEALTAERYDEMENGPKRWC